ncbi:MAG: DNA polymerase III subunit beta [Verrucomicrobiae bacterium]|nr:DNA polymerase III subunit beta [Verrucomicrobiae bacterium]
MPTKFTVAKNDILAGLQKVQNVVSTRTTLPILSNVLMQAHRNEVLLTTTDLDLAVRCSVPAKVQQEGAITLPARKLFTIIREFPASEIACEVADGQTAVWSGGGSVYRIKGLPEEEFPAPPQVANPKKVELEQAQLRDMLRKVSYAASLDESRAFLNGVLMVFKDEKMSVVATDGKRLALVEKEQQFDKKSEAEFIVPIKAVSEIQHLLAGEGNVSLEFSETHLGATIGDARLVTKLVEGTFPNYRHVIPTDAKERISLEREQFLAAVQRAAIMVSDKFPAIRLRFSKGTLTVLAQSPELGEAEETVGIKYKGKDIEIAFNPQYLADPLRHLDADEVIFEFTDPLSPAVIKTNEPFLYVLMPVRQPTA